MFSFEVHITGSENIISALQFMCIKSIVVDLIDREDKVLDTEYMSSFVYKANSYKECREWVDGLVQKLTNVWGVIVSRVKIEVPYFHGEFIDNSLYIEMHLPYGIVSGDYPISVNKISGKKIITDRRYNKQEYVDFINKWSGVNSCEIELCVYDTNVGGDSEWFKSWDFDFNI